MKKSSYLIKNGKVIDPSQKLSALKNLLIVDGKISDILEPNEKVDASRFDAEIDAKGCWVTPGFIDLHVHLRDPGYEWKETIKTGSEAAVLGGFTTICCMPNTNPTNDNPETTSAIITKALEANAAHVLPIGSVSKGLKGKEMAQLTELWEAGCVAFSDDGEPVYNTGMLRRALEWCRMLDDAVVCSHEEDKYLSLNGVMNESALSYRLGLPGIPTIAEEVMIASDIEIARYTKGRIHICHVSTARGVELVRRAKNDGIKITAEVTPHHLLFTEEAIGLYDTSAKMNPPLRFESDRLALIEGLKDGTIDCIASDHAPHDLDTKRIDFQSAAFGIIGLQTNLPTIFNLINNYGLTPEKAISAFSLSPANIFGLKAGRLTKNSVADVNIIDPTKEWKYTVEEIRSISKNTLFLDRMMTGKAKDVFVAGELKVKDFKLNI